MNSRLPLWLLLACVAALPLARRASAAATSPVDIVLAVDNSGSMKRNDPDRLTPAAILHLGEALPPGSRLGLVIFAQDGRLVLPLADVAEPGTLGRLSEALARLDYSGRQTDIPSGLERSLYELRENGRAEVTRALVLFTDGVVDLGSSVKDLERSRWMRNELSAEAKRHGIYVFGIAFTEQADFELVQSLAQTTGGTYFRVLVAQDMPVLFEKLRSQVLALTVPKPAAPLIPIASPVAAAAAGPTKPWRVVALGTVLLLAVAGALIPLWRRRQNSNLIPGAQLVDLGRHTGAKIVRIDRPVFRVGREPATSDLVIPHETVSGTHAEIRFRDGLFVLRDLRSSNGTFLNEKRFSDVNAVAEMPLKHRDRIRFDAYEFEFLEDRLQAAGATVLAGESSRQDAPADEADGQPATPDVLHSGSEESDRRAPDNPADVTILKPERCPRHKGLKATELCEHCGQAFCKFCVNDKDGHAICNECLKAAV